MALTAGRQVHLNGYEGSGDPLESELSGEQVSNFQAKLPAEVDVLIVGGGPAGHLLAAQLSRFPDITTRLIDHRPGRLPHGNADGLQCRTLEIFEAFGFNEKVLKEAYWVNETTFWSPTEGGKGIHRTGRIRDTEEGLSEQPHVILNQARMQDMWVECMKKSATRLEPTYNRRVVDVKRPNGDGPVEVVIERADDAHKGQREYVNARFVVGCDGARSIVRESLGLELKGDYSNQIWGVMDVLVQTDFPDMRIKSAIHSSTDGGILIIPREGGYLSRIYVELDKVVDGARSAKRDITADAVIERAQRIFRPYKFDVREVAHFTVYEVGQRLTDHFDDVPPSEQDTRTPRIFIAGDACHTHSAKAGQGMNVSMNDTFNLGWKLASVLRGHSKPQLLHTYSTERHAVAQTLIDFDRDFAAAWAARPADVAPAAFQAAFERAQRFVAGVETRYDPSRIVSADTTHQALAPGFEIGTRFHSAQVLRVADARPVHLGHVMRADGRWRIVLFGDDCFDPNDPAAPLAEMCRFLEQRVVARYTPQGLDVDGVIDVRAVLQQGRQGVDMTKLPSLLFPRKGKLGLNDYEKVFTDEESYGWGFGDIYNARGVDREKGCVVVVRPDQYVSAVLPLSSDAHRPLLDFFDGFMNVVDIWGPKVTNGDANGMM